MPSANNPRTRKLADAICQSFGQPVISASDTLESEKNWELAISAYARACFEAMSCAGDIPTLLSLPHMSDRDVIATKLLRACVDHGRALAHLLMHNPADFSAAAAGLHRSQFDHLHRALYLRHKATDEEFRIFLEEDELVRITSNGKRANVSAKELAQHTDSIVEGPTAGLFAQLHANSWSELCGLVHGGGSLLRNYHDDSNQIGCSLPPEIQVATLRYATVLAAYAVCVVLNVIGMDEDGITALIADVQSRVTATQQRADQLNTEFARRRMRPA